MRYRPLLHRLLCALQMPLSRRPFVEQLEDRNLLSANPLSPMAVRQAYGFDRLSETGARPTIAIVEAYDAPNIFQDLNTFDQTFSLSPGGQNLYSQFGASNAVLTKVTPEGTPSANAVWSQEASLDVEWAHAIAPAANIMLVEAKSDSIDDLVSAVNYASSHGAQVVSMSWGSQEFAGETAYDSTFQTAGVSYVASSGDTAVPEWPAVSPNVIGVGGTTLSVSAGGAYEGETTWNASGGGVAPLNPSRLTKTA